MMTNLKMFPIVEKHFAGNIFSVIKQMEKPNVKLKSVKENIVIQFLLLNMEPPCSIVI